VPAGKLVIGDQDEVDAAGQHGQVQPPAPVQDLGLNAGQDRHVRIAAQRSTAVTKSGTHAESRRTWSTRHSVRSPRCLAACTFSATVLTPSEKVEWTW
jgi:hypothetical protein